MDILPPASAGADLRFTEISQLIQQARGRALQAVNTQLIELYWQVGAHISRKLERAEWGEGVVAELAAYLARTQPGLRGFAFRNLLRMRRFYESYPNFQFVTSLMSQLSWTHHLVLLSQCKETTERQYYLQEAIKEKWSVRELEGQIKRARFERQQLTPPKVSALLTQIHPQALAVFRDSYVLDFLDLPTDHNEHDLHRGLLKRLQHFLCELGRDFCFVGTEVPLQVGNRDFALDLLLFHRALNCLVALELKVGRFEPEYLGKLNFYLEALDRQHRKPHENPALGVLLCASKDAEVVEYALNRSLSPALIAEYQCRLPDKQLLRAKLQEFYVLDVARTGSGDNP